MLVNIGSINVLLPDHNETVAKLMWLLFNEVLCYSRERNSTASAQTYILYNKFENYTFKITAISHRN